jgi:hypothetical protein
VRDHVPDFRQVARMRLPPFQQLPTDPHAVPRRAVREGLVHSLLQIAWGDAGHSVEAPMTDAKTCWETIKTEGGNVIDAVKKLIHKGNVRRIVIEHRGRTVAEFPLTAGVVGSVLAPPLAAIGAIYALATDCTIKVERLESDEKPAEPRQPTAH